MPRKIYDIKPPKVAHKVEKDLKEFLDGDKAKKHTRRRKEKKSMRAPLFAGAGVIVIIIAVYLFFTLPKADIQIWPKVDTLSFQKTITTDKSADSVDSTNGIIPAQYFEATKTDSQDFPSTGNASNVGQATGTITIYNKFDPPTAFTFKAGTHFMSDSGKLFVALQKVSIPAAQKSGSKITPGSVQVSVQAVEGGDSYNIPPSNFSIPGLKGTPSYYSLYATSTGAMSGGYSGSVKKVTDDDIQGAKDILVKKATADATAALKAQVPSDDVLLDGAIANDTIDASTPTKSGAVTQTFTYQSTVKVSALAFKKSDLDQYAQNYILSQMPDGKTLLDNSYKINYTATTVDVSGGKATLNLNFSSGVYQSIDNNSLTLSMLGENANQINQTINSSLGDQATKVKINFWPFWVTAVPNSQKAVNIELKFQ